MVNIEEWQFNYLKNKLPQHNIVHCDLESFDKVPEHIKDAQILGCFVHSDFNKDFLNSFPISLLEGSCVR